MTKILFARVAITVVLASLTYSCVFSGQKISPTVLPDFNNLVFLTNIPCSAPCWQGLEIGVSTKSEVIGTISTLKFIDQKSIRIIPQQSVPDLNPEIWVPGQNIIATCINSQEPCLHLTIANDKLRDIDIELDSGLTLDEVINHFGAPNYVGSHSKGGDVIDCRIELVWLKQQLIIYSIFFTEPEDVQNRCYSVDENGTPSANLEIAEVRYLPAEDIKQRVERNKFAEFIETK